MSGSPPPFPTDRPDSQDGWKTDRIAQGTGDGDLCFALEQWCLWQSAAFPAQACWPHGEVLPCNGGSAEVGFLPLMQRRRLSPLAKAAMAVAWPCRQGFPDLPAVFSSNHGESRHYFEMLTDLAESREISPSRFSLSVHNAIAGLYSLYGETRAPYVVLAPGQEGVSAALLETAGLLAEQPNRRVLAVWYEQPLPEAYRGYTRGPDCILALAMRLGAVSSHSPVLRLSRRPLETTSSLLLEGGWSGDRNSPRVPGKHGSEAFDPLPNPLPARERELYMQPCQLQRLCQAIAGGERQLVLAGAAGAWHWSLIDG
jgi:hypothetical protein